MIKLNYLNTALFTFSCLGVITSHAGALQPMTDQQLSNITGQALMSLSYIAPNDAANLETKRVSNSNIGFYKLGMEADLSLNANIKKLQLGCGGVNGANACDIDIDNLSLSGLGNSASSNTGNAADRNARVGSSAVLTNPFIQFAIKNPDSASTRQIVGINLSSEKATGLLTFGTENLKDASNNGIPNGINSLSGYMKIAAQTGKATINPITVTQNGATNPTGVPLKGIACDSYFGYCGAIKTTYTTTSYNLTMTPSGQAILALPEQEITGKRISSAILNASTIVNGIAINGNLSADSGLGIPLSGTTSGTLNNLKVNATINESLGLFHKAGLNGTPVSLSLQSQDIQWTGGVSVARTGWWLEMSNPIDIGDITPNKNVDIAMPTIIAALNGPVNDYLGANYVKCGAFALSCLAGNISLGPLNLPNSAPAAPMDMNNLSLKNQDFTPNCYGSLKFC